MLMVHNNPKRTPIQDYKVSMRQNPSEITRRITIRQLSIAVSEADRITQASRQKGSKDALGPTVLMMLTFTDTGKGRWPGTKGAKNRAISSSSQVSGHLGSALLIIHNEQKPRTGHKHHVGRIGDLGRVCAVDKTEG